MSTATADPPKTEKEFVEKVTGKKPAYDEKVTYRHWDPYRKAFNNPQRNVTSFRALVDGKRTIFLTNITGQKPPAGSQIEDADGNVYVVTAATHSGATQYGCTVVKSAAQGPQ